jgi:acyl transferase domain-containing protein
MFIGSAKTNIGHLEAAAGVAGLIKAVLSMQRAQIPQHLHFKELNPFIDLTGTGFRIPTTLTNWPSMYDVKNAAVSSFGL